MATHSSASMREQASHGTRPPHFNQTTRTSAINHVLKQRAQAVLNNTAIDAETRAVIRYGLETNDPWLAELVLRADAGEKFAETFDFSQTTQATEVGPTAAHLDVMEQGTDELEPRIEVLTEIICAAGDEPAGVLFVLMGTIQHSTNPEVLANAAKHLAFTRCGELNLFGMVDAQIAVLEDELFAHSKRVS